MTTAAAWAAAVALWLGALVPGPWWLVGVALIVGAAGLVWSRVRTVAVLGALVLLGSGSSGGRLHLQQSGPVAELAQTGGQAAATATVVTEPRAGEFGLWSVVRLSSLDGRRTRERALLRTDKSTGVQFGDRLSFTATARPLGDKPFDDYLRQLGAGVAITPTGRISRAPPGPAASVTNLVRGRVRGAARGALHAAAAGLLTGLVTGDTSLLPPEVEDQLTGAGLSHLVAVSGSNVALVVAGALALAGAGRLGARGRRRLAAGAVIAFVLLVRAEPSVLRAAVMAGFVLAAQATGRGTRALHALAAAVLVLLLVDPLLAGQLGFALSVLATAGVLVAAPALMTKLRGPPRLVTLLAATIGAQLAVAPVLLVVEGAVPLASVPANLVAVPAAAVASALGVIMALAAQVAAPLGSVVARAARPALEVVLWGGRTFVDGPQLTSAMLLSPVAALLGATLLTRRRAPKLSLAAAAMALIIGLWPSVRPAQEVSALTLTALDVGQGDALLVESPGAAGTARLLVDGGPDLRRAVRRLRRRGVRRLDAVVVSHPHADHTDGLLAVLSQLRVGALVVGPDPPQALDDPAPSASALLAVARSRGIPVLRVAAGQSFPLGSARADVLSPPADGSLGAEPNENSLVLRVIGDHGALLLTGDAEALAQDRLLRDPGQVAAQVLKVPHHGGNTNAQGFLQAVGARVAVIGVGSDNDYGHPRQEVLEDLGGAAVLRTDLHGDVSVVLERGGVRALR